MIKRNISQSYAILLGASVLLFFYFINIFIYLFQGGEGIFLSLGMMTDSSYLPLLVSENIYKQEGLTFSFLPFLIERQFIALFGFHNTWLMLILYKVTYFLVFLVGFKNLLKPERNTLNIMAVSLALFFCIDLPPFSDRYPRPQFDNIFLISILLFNLFLLQKRKLSYVLFSAYGLFHSILALTNPWAVAIIAPMSLISIIRSENFLKPVVSLFSFLVVILPISLYFYTNLDGSSHREFLGLKDIYKPFLFVQDYLASLMLSKQFLLILAIITFFSILLKRKIELSILILCFFLAPFAFLIFGKSIQIYHLINGMKEFQILICITIYFYLIQKTELKIFCLEIKHSNLKIAACSVILSICLITISGNSWISRANDIQDNWKKYSSAYEFLDEKSSSCKIISNDQNIRTYWSGLKGGITLPKDGFIRTSNIKLALKEVEIAINALSKDNALSEHDINSLLKYATHNYFVSTRSTLTKTLPFTNDIEKDAYLVSRKTVNSMQAWSFAPPESIYNLLFRSNDSSKDLYDLNDTLIMYKSSDKEKLKFSIIDNCSNNL